LVESLSHARDLTELCGAHAKYLEHIVSGAFVSSRHIVSNVGKQFKLILRFVRLQVRIYDASAAEVRRRDAAARSAYQKAKTGKCGLANLDYSSKIQYFILNTTKLVINIQL